MNELIKVEKTVIGGKMILSLSARELYVGLGLNPTHWARWSKDNIENNAFFLQNIDFIQLSFVASPDNPKPPKDYAISIEFAKHIAMQARTKKSHEYRSYMIQCETKAMSQLPDFTNPAIAARAWAEEFEAKQAALKQIEADKPKVEFAMAVRNMQGACSVGEFAKTIGTGRNRLFKQMRDDSILMANNQPYQRYIDQGLFVVIEQIPYTDSNGKTHPAFTTMITGKGQVWLESKYRGVLGKRAA